jgi:NADPH:quinone reductase
MRVVQLSRFGGPEVLEVLETPTPDLKPAEVLIRVRAAGINFFEVLMRQDRYATTPDLPLSMGVEVAGLVEAVGSNVPTEIVGRRVAVPLFAIGQAGGYADYVVAGERDIFTLPDTLSFEDAAALQVQGLTALHMVRQSAPKAKTILVTAAAGGVGSLLVQIARSSGTSLLIAAAGTDEKRQLALSLGADVAVDYSNRCWSEDVRALTGGRGVDIVYDLVGGALTKACLEALAPGGELIFGALGRVDLDRADLEDLFARNQSIRGFALLPLVTAAGMKTDLAWLFDQAAEGRLTVLHGGRYPLDQVADAHRAVESRATAGKVVLIP